MNKLSELAALPAPDLMGDVEAFHVKFGQEYLGLPRVLDVDLESFRDKFIDEEVQEYRDDQVLLAELLAKAMGEGAIPDGEIIAELLANQLDALVDGVYVLLGTAYLKFGAERFKEAWRRVQTANMAKVRANPDGDDRSHRNATFDIVKPEGWTAPDHYDLVQEHEHRG